MAKAPAVISQKDYLQKYLTGKNADKKKKKRKISKIAKEKRSVIVDDDEIKGMRELADGELDLFSMSEDAPQIAGIIDERPEELKTIETFRSSARWKVISDEHGIEDIQVVAVPGQPKSPRDSDDDLSPARNTRDDSDESPPRKHNRSDSGGPPPRSKDDSPWGRREKRPGSPSSTQHRRDRDQSRHARQGSDARDSKDDDRLQARIKIEPESPPRKGSADARTRNSRETFVDSDESPPRRNSRKTRESPDAAARTDRRDKELHSSKSRKESQKYDSDESPPRKSKKRNYNDSPPRKHSRKTRESPEELARKNRRDPELFSSKNRKESRKYDSDESPPRKSKKGNSDEVSPRRNSMKTRESPEESSRRIKHSSSRRDKELVSSKSGKKSRKYDSDESPPRRSKKENSDESPPRRHRKEENNEQIDRSRSHRQQHSLGQDPSDRPRKSRKADSDSDNSPPRKPTKMPREKDSEPSRLASRRARRDSPEKDRGHRAEGQSKGPEIGVSDADLMPIYRDRKTGRKRDLAAEAQQRKEEEAKTDVAKAKYTRWGAGLAQVAERETRVQDALHEATKPVARFADDADLDAMLRARDREGDPMLEYIKAKSQDVSVPSKPRYVGSFPPNRYGIAPGHRWDGVDRSTGFERRWFEGTAARQAVAEDAYKWSVADM